MITPAANKTSPDKLKRDPSGRVVFRTAIWNSSERSRMISVYGFTGVTKARAVTLWRAVYSTATQSPEQLRTIAANAALLTALHMGVSDFVILANKPVITDDKGNIL